MSVRVIGKKRREGRKVRKRGKGEMGREKLRLVQVISLAC